MFYNISLTHVRSVHFIAHFHGCNPHPSPCRPPVLGPALPPGFRRATHEQNDDEDADVVGPALPPDYQPDSSSSEDEDVIGPMPSRGPTEDSVAKDFERRAQRMKEKLTGAVHSPLKNDKLANCMNTNAHFYPFAVAALFFYAYISFKPTPDFIYYIIRKLLRCWPEKHG